MSAQQTDTPIEIEIKFHLPAGSRAALERGGPLTEAPGEHRHEVTTYYDTPGQTLAAAGVSLRVRSSGNRLVQTVKAAPEQPGAGFGRAEWEWAVPSAAPVPERLRETPFTRLFEDAREQLAPVFATEIDRTVRQLCLDDGTEVEAAIDEGAIRADGSEMAVSELELELKAGPPGPLYRLAIDLHERAPLWIASESKAARGYRLRTGRPPEAARAAKPALGPSAGANAAFRTIVQGGVAHILANAAAAEAGAVEGVHQFRVGLRRLRSALVLFAPLLEPNAAGLLEDDLRTLGRVLGERRDRDVFCAETLQAAARETDSAWIDRLRPAAEAYRAAALPGVIAGLHGPAFTGLVLGLCAWSEEGAAAPDRLGNARLGARLGKVGPALLDRLARKAARRARRLDTPEALHALRKSLKKLRYATEFLAGLGPEKAVKRYRKRCEALQERLGTINDAHVTPALGRAILGAHGPELAPAIALLAEWSAGRAAQARDGLDKALADFARTEPFWR